MITIKKMKSFVLTLALFGGMSVFAQQPQQQLQQQQQQKVEVNDSDLEQFATVTQGVMQKNQEVQQEMLGEIEKEGLTGERYTELQMAEQNPTAKSDASEEELNKKKKIDRKLDALNQELQKKQVAIIEDNGMTVERYQEIANAVQSDQSLLEKYQKIAMKKAQNAAE